jgi:hypothetical protein
LPLKLPRVAHQCTRLVGHALSPTMQAVCARSHMAANPTEPPPLYGMAVTTPEPPLISGFWNECVPRFGIGITMVALDHHCTGIRIPPHEYRRHCRTPRTWREVLITSGNHPVRVASTHWRVSGVSIDRAQPFGPAWLPNGESTKNGTAPRSRVDLARRHNQGVMIW